MQVQRPPLLRMHALRDVISAPLFITVVGALLAGYLIPRIASRVEDHRKAREIQSSLVQDMSQAVGRLALTGQLLATRSIKKENANGTSVFDAALLQWESDKAAIEAQLQTYFSKARLGSEALPKAWDDYTGAVDNLYFLSTTELSHRCDRTKMFMTYLGVSVANLSCPQAGWTSAQWGAACRASTSWSALALCDEDSLKTSGEGYVRGPNYFDAYKGAVTELLADETRLLGVVRKNTPTGF